VSAKETRDDEVDGAEAGTGDADERDDADGLDDTDGPDDTDGLNDADDQDDADERHEVDETGPPSEGTARSAKTGTATRPATGATGTGTTGTPGTTGKAATPGTSAAPTARPEDPPPPNTMLPKEQQTGYLVAVAVVAWVGAAGVSRVVAGHNEYILLSVLGLAGAGAIFYSARRGRRIFGAIVSILAGLAVSGFFPLNFACLIYGGYLMLKQSSAQKKYNLAHPRGARKQRDRSGQPDTRRGRNRQPEPTNRPQASRRYTPPKAKTNRKGR
jgi:hypothetical protein